MNSGSIRRTMLHLSSIRNLIAAAFLGPVHVVAAQQGSHTIPVYYDASLQAAGFPSPVVKATIAGHEGLFLIDTGAGVNTLAQWFADAAKIPTKPISTTLTGSTGAVSRARAALNIRGAWSDGKAF